MLCTEREVADEQSRTIDQWVDGVGAADAVHSMFVTLQEQAPMKTEHGQKFPAAAFAFVPDIDKPSTWKLRLWESTNKQITRGQLSAAAALLREAEVPEGGVAKVKARFRFEYAELNIKPHNIPKSVQESEPMSLILGREAAGLTTADYDGDKGEVTVTVIKPGFNISKRRFYPAKTLARDYKVFEGLKMFADHPTASEDRDRPERSVRGWVGNITNVFMGENGEIKARAKIHEGWFKEKLAGLAEHGLLNEMGTSIVALGKGVKTKIEGHTTQMVEQLVKGRSVDFVTYPGAGGSVECYESAQPEDEYDVDVIDAVEFKQRRPDIVELIETEIRESLGTETKVMDEKDTTIKELKEANETLTTENGELQESVTANEEATAKTKAQGEIVTLISESELPDPTKARLTEQFKEAQSIDGVAEAIESAKTEIAALTESGKVAGLGVTEPDALEPDKEAQASLRESNIDRYMSQGKTKEEAEAMADTFTKG
jgi:hypothetical protein